MLLLPVKNLGVLHPPEEIKINEDLEYNVREALRPLGTGSHLIQSAQNVWKYWHDLKTILLIQDKYI